MKNNNIRIDILEYRLAVLELLNTLDILESFYNCYSSRYDDLSRIGSLLQILEKEKKEILHKSHQIKLMYN